MIASSVLGRIVSGEFWGASGPWCPVLFVVVSVVRGGGASSFHGADSVESISRSGLRGNNFAERTPRKLFRGADSLEIISRSGLCLSKTLCSEL